MDIESLKFPVGEFVKPTTITPEIVNSWISDIESFPSRLNEALSNITPEQLNYAYRPNGWTIKQVVHHCVDSHINSIIRFKLALTEDQPTIRPYNQDAWISLPDATVNDISASMKILDGLHEKWAFLLKNLTQSELQKLLIHPEHKAPLTIRHFIGLYAWHCNHHLAHVLQALKHKGRFNLN